MMRGMTILWAILAIAVGVGVFMLKYEVQALEDRLAQVNRAIYQNEEAIHVLKAEWSYLNDPNRLRELAERHLAMKPMKATQIAAIDALPMNDGSAMLASSPKAAAPEIKPSAAPAPAATYREAKATAPAVAKPPAAVKPILAAAPKPLAAEPAGPKASSRRPAPVPMPSLPAKPAKASPQVSPQIAPLPAGNVLVIKSPALEAPR